jgi:PAS domain S-box-containing protein
MIDPVSGDLVATGHPLGQVRPRRVLGARSSPTSEAVWSGKPVAIVSQEDYRTRYPEAALELGPDGVPMSSLSLPLRFRGDSIGALGFTVPDSQRFSERDVTLAQGLADSVAAALERLRLQDAERGVAVVQAGLARLARVALEAIDQAVFAQKVIEEMCATTGASAAVVYLLDASTDELVRLAATGGSEALLAQPARFPVSTPKAATEALRTGTAVYVDTEEYAKRWPDTLPAYKAEGLESFACLQLAVPDRIIGTMTVGFPERRLFDTDERAVLETFVATAAQGLDRLRLHEAVRLSAERQAAVAGIARFALEATDEVALARKIVDETAAIAHAAAVSVYLLDPPTGDLVLLAMSGWSEESGDRFVRVSPSTRSAAADAIRDLNDIYVQDAEEYARLWPEMIDSYRAERLEASAVLQLAVPERVTGIMSIGFREAHAFDSTERNTLATIAAAAAQGLERLRAQAAERKSLRLLESVVTQMPVGLRILAPDGRVITSNQPAIAPWRGGGEVRSVADYPSWPTFHPDGRPYRTEERPAVRALSGEVVVEEEVTIERFDGTRGVLAVSAAPVRDDAGQIIAGVVITTDITERKDQEASREAFMAVLSHEMRTPMTSISGAARILQVRGNALDVTTRAGLYEDIADEADRMNRMVENLLVLSRVERRMVQPADEPLLLARTMPRLVEAEQVFWPDSTFLLHCTDDRPIVHADVDYLEHIMQNLLSNAAKYAPGEVEVDVAADHASREVIIAVRDHGRGVSSEDASHLFELFWRSPKQTTLARGAGVGLFVVRKLVEAMGGRVWLDESVTDGARFVVALQALDENDWVG